jgi:hypothetical protein
MSATKTPDAPGLNGLIDLTEKLTRLLADQARAFERHRPQDAAARLPEVARLTYLYRTASAGIQAQPALASGAPPEARERLLSATRDFDAVLQRHGKALAASKTVTEGLVRAVAETIAAKRASNVGYGPGSGRRAAATAITLNQQA